MRTEAAGDRRLSGARVAAAAFAACVCTVAACGDAGEGQVSVASLSGSGSGSGSSVGPHWVGGDANGWTPGGGRARTGGQGGPSDVSPGGATDGGDATSGDAWFVQDGVTPEGGDAVADDPEAWTGTDAGEVWTAVADAQGGDADAGPTPDGAAWDTPGDAAAEDVAPSWLDVEGSDAAPVVGVAGEAGGGDAIAQDTWIGAADAPAYDAGGWDAGGWDAGAWDAGGWDAGGWDAGGWDAGGWDAGGWDAGGSDATGTFDVPWWSDLVAPDGTSTDGAGWDPGGPGTDGFGSACPEEAKHIYVVTNEELLYRFDATSLALDPIGKLDCPAGLTDHPFSMSVDRQAVAWVVYETGKLYKVSTTDASCTPTLFAPGQFGFGPFGMGFVSDAPNSETETLFVASASLKPTGKANKLGTIDTETLQISPIGTLPADVGSPELTGNAAGELWGFSPDLKPPAVQRIDKATAEGSSPFLLPELQAPNVRAWAFAWWGGRFYLFHQTWSQPSTQVWQLNATTGKNVKVMTDVGVTIVGAGVSTCAPMVPY